MDTSHNHFFLKKNTTIFFKKENIKFFKTHFRDQTDMHKTSKTQSNKIVHFGPFSPSPLLPCRPSSLSKILAAGTHHRPISSPLCTSPSLPTSTLAFLCCQSFFSAKRCHFSFFFL